MKPLKISSEREIFNNSFLRVYSVEADFGEFSKEYFVTQRSNRVGIIIRKNDSVLLVRQYRFMINDESWELPGGGIDEGEDPAESIVREAKEEAGIECRKVSAVFDYPQGVDVTRTHAYLFECEDFEELDVELDDETDKKMWVPVDRCLAMISEGQIRDSMTIIALLANTHPQLPR